MVIIPHDRSFMKMYDQSGFCRRLDANDHRNQAPIYDTMFKIPKS